MRNYSFLGACLVCVRHMVLYVKEVPHVHVVAGRSYNSIAIAIDGAENQDTVIP